MTGLPVRRPGTEHVPKHACRGSRALPDAAEPGPHWWIEHGLRHFGHGLPGRSDPDVVPGGPHPLHPLRLFTWHVRHGDSSPFCVHHSRRAQRLRQVRKPVNSARFRAAAVTFDAIPNAPVDFNPCHAGAADCAEIRPGAVRKPSTRTGAHGQSGRAGTHPPNGDDPPRSRGRGSLAIQSTGPEADRNDPPDQAARPMIASSSSGRW